MANSFYNRVLNNIDSFLTPSYNREYNRRNLYDDFSPLKKSLSFNRDTRSFSSSIGSTSNRLKRLVSTIEGIQPYYSPLRRNFTPLVDKQKRIDHLEELLQEERTKNTSYLDEIYELNQRIDDLSKKQSKSKHVCRCKHDYDSKEIEVLMKENEELRRFKEDVFDISKIYDDINENVIISLQEIDKLFTKINESKHQMTYTQKAQKLETAKASFEQVINTLIKMMKKKQEEYNFLLNDKDKEISALKDERDELNHKVTALKDTLNGNICRKDHYDCNCNHHCSDNHCNHHCNEDHCNHHCNEDHCNHHCNEDHCNHHCNDDHCTNHCSHNAIPKKDYMNKRLRKSKSFFPNS